MTVFGHSVFFNREFVFEDTASEKTVYSQDSDAVARHIGPILKNHTALPIELSS